MNKATLPFISFNHAEKLVKECLKTQLAVILRGSPSSGKTAIGYKIAKEASLEPVVFSLLDHEPTDISGLPNLSGSKATFQTFDTFPIEGDELPEGKVGWLIMLDEFSSGTRAMQAAANKLLYERMVGNKKLHERCYVIAMGNLATDNAFVIEEPQHTKSRMVHLFVQQDINEWIEWAFKSGIDTRVIAYAEMKPTVITKYDPQSVDINYPCARTMAMLSDLIKGNNVTRNILPLIQGVIGTGNGLEFYNFCQLRDELPSISDILKEPLTTPVPDKMQHRYCLSTLIAEHFNEETAETLVQYIQRMNMEAQYFIFRASVLRNPKLISLPQIRDFCAEISAKYNK